MPSDADYLSDLVWEQQHAVSCSWAGIWESPADVLCDAWLQIADADTVTEAERVAVNTGVTASDAGLLADALIPSRSPNWTREIWVDAATTTFEDFDGATSNDFYDWLIDADLTTKPLLGVRITAEAAALALSTFDPPRQQHLAVRFAEQLYARTRPPLIYVRRALAGAGGFCFRGRWYVYGTHHNTPTVYSAVETPPPHTAEDDATQRHEPQSSVNANTP